MKFINHVELKAGIKDSADSLGTAGQVLSSTGSTTQWVTASLSGFVPYTGATGNVNLGVYNLSANAVTLNPTPATIPTAQGSMYFDEDEETLAVILNGTTQRVGEDVFFQIKNQTGVTIPKGTAVRFDGVVGVSGRLLAVPFLANGTYTSQYFLGVTSEAILDGDDGKAYVNGKVLKLNTNGYTVGTILYCSSTVAGGFQTTPPIAPNNIISVAVVIVKSATVGKLLIRPQLGSNINNDEGVKIVGGSTGNLLQLQSNGLWENKTLAQAGIQPTLTNPITGSLTTNYIPKATGANSLGNSRIFDNGTNVGIGTTNPVQKLHVEGSTAIGTTGTEDILILGRTLSAGVSFQQAASLKLGRYQNVGGSFESYTRLDFALKDNSFESNYNTNTTVMTLTNAGNVGIGTTTPQSKLDVNGSIKVGDDTAVASASNAGAQRYRVSGNNSYVDVCMQTGASTYEWTNITQHNW